MKTFYFLLRFLLLVAALALIGPAAPAQDPAPAAQDEDAAPELETFIPTEKLPADSAISFPVDI